MATVNLGSIKFNWQGAYAGGTAYAVDDVVSYNGSSYVCKLASTGNLPTNTTYWDVMSLAGTDGTDLTTTLTTQGDLVYYNGSALARLGAGTSGQFLKTLGTGANPTWGDVAGGVVQMTSSYAITSASTSATSYVDTAFTVAITPTSTSNKILIIAQGAVQVSNGRGFLSLERSGYGDLHGDVGATSFATYEGNVNRNGFVSFMYLDAPSSTSALTYKVRYRQSSPSDTFSYGNIGGTVQQMFAIELDGGIF